MINNATFEEIGQTRGGSAAAIFIHDFFVTNASSILFHLAPCRFFRLLSPSRPIKFAGDQRKYTVALKISVTPVAAFIIFKGLI